MEQKTIFGFRTRRSSYPTPRRGQRARPHGLHHHVGAGGQFLQDGDAGVGAQVEHQRALPPVDVQVHEGRALDDGPRHLADVVAGGRLHLDHVGAQVDQRRGDGGRPQGRALDDPQSVQWRRRRHRTSRRQRADRSGRRPGHPQPEARHTGAVETEPLDDALTIFAGTAPLYGSAGLANHGPMAAEALAHLGRSDAIPDWVAQYRRPPRRCAAAGASTDRGRVAGRARPGGPLPRVARALRARDRRPSRRGGGRGVGAAAAPGRRRCGDARVDPHRSRVARAGRRRHAAAAPRGGARPGFLGVELYRSCRDRRCSSGTRAWPMPWPTCRTSPRTRHARC